MFPSMIFESTHYSPAFEFEDSHFGCNTIGTKKLEESIKHRINYFLKLLSLKNNSTVTYFSSLFQIFHLIPEKKIM